MKGLPRGSIGDLFQWMVDHGTIHELSLFVLICWSLWYNRNLLVFQEKISLFSEVLSKAVMTKELYCLSSNLAPSFVEEEPKISHWSPPQDGVIKVNVDAAVSSSMDHFGVGLAGRDGECVVLCVEGKYLPGLISPLLAELIAIKT